jgi:hypothetical protein
MFALPKLRAYALASMEIMHGLLAPDVSSDLDYVWKV